MGAADEDPAAESSLLHELNSRRRSKPLRELPTLLGEALRLVWRAAPRDATVVVVCSVAVGVLTAVQLWLTQRLLAAVLAVGDGGDLSSVTPELIAFVVMLVVLGVLTLVQDERKRVLSEMVSRYSQRLVAEVAARADLVDFVRPSFHDRLQRSMANASTRPVQVTYGLMGMIMAAFTVAGVVIALAVVQPVLLLLALIAFGPVWLVARKLSRLSYAFDVDETEADRRRSYLLMLLTAKQPAKEVRAFELDGFFADYHGRLWDERLDRLRRFTDRRVRLGIVGQIINGVLFGAVVALLVYLISSGRTTVSDAAVAAGAVLILGQRMGVLVGSGGQLYESSLFLGDTQRFLDEFAVAEATHVERPPAPPLESLAAEHVTFRYPAGTADALTDVSVEVRTGEVVALVGVNGSGKTTLAKVLAHLYSPAAGRLTWNGVDAATFDPSGIRDQTAVIFQDFERYMFTAGENVGFGRHPVADDGERVADAAERAGAGFVAGLPRGYETLLGPEFIGGSDLSIGQWQRIAIARAFFRDANLVILDEPSSALDAEAEADLFERLRELCAGRAVVVISHRFSTVTSADRIYVLEQGRVIEHGSHRELMSEKGTYARMFELQAAQYRDDGSGQELPVPEVDEERLEVGPGDGGLDVVDVEHGLDHGVEGGAAHQ